MVQQSRGRYRQNCDWTKGAGKLLARQPFHDTPIWQQVLRLKQPKAGRGGQGRPRLSTGRTWASEGSATRKPGSQSRSHPAPSLPSWLFYKDTDSASGHGMSDHLRCPIRTEGQWRETAQPRNTEMAVAMPPETRNQRIKAGRTHGYVQVSILNGKRLFLYEYDSAELLPENERDDVSVVAATKRNLKTKSSAWQWSQERHHRLVTHSCINCRISRRFVSIAAFCFDTETALYKKKGVHYADHGVFSIYHYILLSWHRWCFVLILVWFHTFAADLSRHYHFFYARFTFQGTVL